jgi:hypothetical protein
MRTKQYRLVMTPAEHEALAAEAARRQIPMSELLRMGLAAMIKKTARTGATQSGRRTRASRHEQRATE